ncbi:MAG: DNA polymerase III subunit delta [Christensenellales bacterium]
MKSTQLLDEFNKKESRLYLFHGEETYLKEEALKRLYAAYETKLPQFNVDVLRDWTMKELENSCETLPFIDGQRIVVARFSAALESCGETELENIENFLKRISETTVLVFYAETKLDARKALYKMLSRYCTVGEFDMLADWEAAQWVEKKAAAGNKPVSSGDARYLVALAGQDLSMLHNELCKLFDYCSGGITKQDIDYIVTRSVEYSVFQVLDSLEQNKPEGWSELKTLMATEEIPKIIGAMAARFRLMLQCREYLEEGLKDNQVLQKMGAGYGVRQALSGCRKFTLDRLREAMRLLSSADYDMKNGLRKDKHALMDALLKIYGLKTDAKRTV